MNNDEQQRLADRPPPINTSQQQANYNKTRVVEIPVKHYNLPESSQTQNTTNASSLPSANNSYINDNFREGSPLRYSKRPDPFKQRGQNFFNTPSLFDTFDDPDFGFGESPFEADPRFPILSRFGLPNRDELFHNQFYQPKQQQQQQQQPDNHFNRPDLIYRPHQHTNSPARELLNVNNNLNSQRSHSQPRSTPPKSQPQQPQVIDQQQQQQQQQAKESSPIPVVHSDSPKRYISQTTIYPNTSPSTSTGTSPGIPIRINHLNPTQPPAQVPEPPLKQQQPAAPSTPNNKSDFKYTESESMGTTMSSQNQANKAKSNFNSNISDFTGQPKATNKPPQQSAPSAAVPSAKKAKTPQEKCEDVAKELERIEKDVEQFTGKKSDRSYLTLEELLTRCLIKVDEIERGDDQLNQTRKGLINMAHKLSDRLEGKAAENSETNNKNCTNDSNQTTTTGCSPPESKRTKTPTLNEQQQTNTENTAENTELAVDSNQTSTDAAAANEIKTQPSQVVLDEPKQA